jgi:ribonuclease BN (tRNA processing enzyme)
MKIRLLGAHSVESAKTGMTTVLIDDALAVDAGSLTSHLTFEEQQQLKGILLTHQHYDHIRDIPALGMNFYLHNNCVDVYATHTVYQTLTTNLINDVLYPNYIKKPPEKPAIKFHTVEAGRIETIAGYSVLPVKVNHAVPTVGFQITSVEGKKVFISSDTGPGLADCWKQVSPDLLVIETTMLNKNEESARMTGHLTAELLRQELISFKEINSYIPQVIVNHINALDEKEIRAELDAVSKVLNTGIMPGYEGMRINL